MPEWEDRNARDFAGLGVAGQHKRLAEHHQLDAIAAARLLYPLHRFAAILAIPLMLLAHSRRP